MRIQKCNELIQWIVVFFFFCLPYLCPNREGDISLIESDAITNTTDETLTEKNTISNRIFQRAGPDLYDEILNDNRGMNELTIHTSFTVARAHSNGNSKRN